MLKVSNVEVMNFENAIRGMRNPLNSWDKSDSGYGCECSNCDSCYEANECNFKYDDYILGENDLDLAKRLCKAGSDHRKFLRQIMVSVDILAPLYWWKEFDTYKVGTVANSCSTMHKIHAKEFTLDDFSCENLFVVNKEFFEKIIELLNYSRQMFIETKIKSFWWQMILMLPSNYNQLRTVTLNYEVLRNMYHSRKNHKLDEWHTLCDWIATLPYAKELIIGEE